jgi:hypothetical protein
LARFDRTSASDQEVVIKMVGTRLTMKRARSQVKSPCGFEDAIIAAAARASTAVNVARRRTLDRSRVTSRCGSWRTSSTASPAAKDMRSVDSTPGSGFAKAANPRMPEASHDEKAAVANHPEALASTSTWARDLEP